MCRPPPDSAPLPNIADTALRSKLKAESGDAFSQRHTLCTPPCSLRGRLDSVRRGWSAKWAHAFEEVGLDTVRYFRLVVGATQPGNCYAPRCPTHQPRDAAAAATTLQVEDIVEMDEETLEELKDELKNAGAKTAHVRLPRPLPPHRHLCSCRSRVRVLTY